MKEIEVKILEIDRSLIEKRLQEIGAIQTFDGEMQATFFDFPDGQITRRGDVLRLRQEGEQVQLVYKAHLSTEGAKVMEEYESRVENAAALRAVFTHLGLQVIKETRKRRTSYRWQGAHIEIDDYQEELAYIPVFLEIEAPSMQQIGEIIRLLGYSPADALSWSTYDLVRHYRPN